MIHKRCSECFHEAVEALADADWIVEAGGDAYSDAVITDQALARMWLDVAWLHDGEDGTP